MKVKLWPIIAVSLLCLALAGAIACPGPGEGAVGGELVEVVRGDITVIISGSGNITVSQDASLAFGTGGKVEAVYVEEGGQVSQGDVLAQLDTGALELALAQAQLILSTAEYNLDKTQQVYSQPDINTARAAVSSARSYLQYAKVKLDVEANTVEQREYWENEVYQAEVNLAAAEQRLEEMQAGGESAEVKLRRLEVAAARQALEQAQKELAEATITAPFDGIVGAIYVEKGDIIPPPTMAPTVAIYLITPTSLELKAEVDEIDIPDVKAGQSAVIEVDAYPDERFGGTVASISPVPVIEAGLVLYEVTISLTIPANAGLMVGMSATADITVQQSKDTLLVPERAVGRDSQGNPVVWVSVNGQLEERPVVVGISDGLQAEILEGVTEGEMVAVEKRGTTELGGFF